MYDLLPMTTQKRRQKIFWVSFLLMVAFYLVCEYFSTPNSYTNILYGSQYKTTSENPSEEFIEEDDLPSQLDNNFEKIFDIQNQEGASNANISITVFSTEQQKMFRVDYDKPSRDSPVRELFAQMRDIKKSASNILFLETRCSTEKGAKDYVHNKGFILNVRQCCAIESTALTNLDKDIYVFHSCPLSDDFLKFSPKYVQKLFRYPNLRVVRLNSAEAFMDSPIQDLFEKKQLESSQYPIEHTSDLLRMILLWKFGGSYFDLDVVNIRSVTALKSNFAGAQDHETIANGVVNFEPDGVGHEILQQALEYANKHFDASNWSTNGPLLITPIILRVCNVTKVFDAVDKCQGNFTVFPQHVFYPLYYPVAGYFFDQSRGREIVNEVKNKSFSVHIWNRMNRDMVGVVGSNQAYALLADEFCPEVYRNCGTRF